MMTIAHPCRVEILEKNGQFFVFKGTAEFANTLTLKYQHNDQETSYVFLEDSKGHYLAENIDIELHKFDKGSRLVGHWHIDGDEGFIRVLIQKEGE